MADIQKISVALTAEQIEVLESAVKAGEYATTSEIVGEALREWQLRRGLRGEDLNRLRELWQQGKASGAAQPLDFTEAREEARHRLKKAAERIA